MKIHTTQNLNSLVQNQPSTINVSSRDFRSKVYSEQMPELSANADYYSSSVSFGKKKPSLKDTKKIINTTKKIVGEIKKEPQLERTKGDKFKTSSLFNKMLEVSKYETVIQAGMAAIICTIFRPLTIMSLPSKKGKDDNIYASAHSIASGIVGLIATAALTTPFKFGADHVKKVMLKDLNKESLKRLFPQLDIKSIEDAASKVRRPVSQWLDKEGNSFHQEIKDVDKLPEFKQLADVSEKTFSKVLKVDVNWAEQNGNSFNDIILNNGEKLYDHIDMSRLGIVVKEDGMRDAQILLKDLDKNYLTKLIKDSKDQGSKWADLDIKSVYADEKGKVVKDFREWKDINGKQWKLDLDTVSVSSPYETIDYRPRISGDKTFVEKEQVYKFTTYQKNGVDGKLGTAINKDMLAAETRNEAHMKLLTWLPDILFRVPIAATTIALIPVILKTIFKVEKPKKNTQAENNKQIEQNKTAKEENTQVKQEQVNFKGKGDSSKKASWFVRKFGEWYGKPLLENKKVAKVSEYLTKLPGNITQHMATLGSLITSSVYVQQTLTKKDLDPERRRTLAINQILCFFIPTIAAYTVDKMIKNWTKKQEYGYSGLLEHTADIAKYEGRIADSEKIYKGLGEKLKGVRILATLATFTLIYRYATPVIITPIANKIGEMVNNKKHKHQNETQKTV